jgi:hypothetical protein
MTVTENQKGLVIVGVSGMVGGDALRSLDHSASAARPRLAFISV